jgi:hypothetical protein
LRFFVRHVASGEVKEIERPLQIALFLNAQCAHKASI